MKTMKINNLRVGDLLKFGDKKWGVMVAKDYFKFLNSEEGYNINYHYKDDLTAIKHYTYLNGIRFYNIIEVWRVINGTILLIWKQSVRTIVEEHILDIAKLLNYRYITKDEDGYIRAHTIKPRKYRVYGTWLSNKEAQVIFKDKELADSDGEIHFVDWMDDFPFDVETEELANETI